MRHGRHRHHRRHRNHRSNRFEFGNRNSPVKDSSNVNTKTFSKPTEKKQTTKPSFLSKITLRYKIFLGLLILNLIVYIFLNLLFIFVIPLDVLFVIIWLWGWTRTCPRCKSHWARKLVDRSNFGTHTEFRDVTKNMTHRDSHGNVIGTSSVRDTKPVVMHTIQNHWVCKYCHHSWSGRVHSVQG